MSDMPAEILELLRNPSFRRESTLGVRSALERLSVSVPESFREFYELCQGPFGSRVTGYELLDLCEQQTNILQSTLACRQHYGWPARLIVLTDSLGNGALVLDVEKDQVFDVDFEGGDSLLLNRLLPPTWASFASFLRFYFGDGCPATP